LNQSVDSNNATLADKATTSMALPILLESCEMCSQPIVDVAKISKEAQVEDADTEFGFHQGKIRDIARSFFGPNRQAQRSQVERAVAIFCDGKETAVLPGRAARPFRGRTEV
jgi:hypothetical protein